MWTNSSSNHRVPTLEYRSHSSAMANSQQLPSFQSIPDTTAHALDNENSTPNSITEMCVKKRKKNISVAEDEESPTSSSDAEEESFVENSKLYIVMEHADGGDLSGAIAKRKETNKPWYSLA